MEDHGGRAVRGFMWHLCPGKLGVYRLQVGLAKLYADDTHGIVTKCLVDGATPFHQHLPDGGLGQAVDKYLPKK